MHDAPRPSAPPAARCAVMLAAVSLLVGGCGRDEGVEPPPRGVTLPPRARLLTAAQVSNAVADLLGVTAPVRREPGTRPHQLVHEDVRAVDGQVLVQLRITAETVADQVASDPGVVGCEDGPAADACAIERATRFAARAFRRPLAVDEAEALTSLYAQGRGADPARAASPSGRASGLAAVVEAVLQAPSFVYRSELGEPGAGPGLRALTAHELAAELGWLLLDSVPDDELWAAAEDGSLLAPGVVAAHVERLLSGPRAQAHLTDVILRWLDVYSVLEVRKDPGRFPDATPALFASMLEETRLFVGDVLWRRGGSFQELLSSDETFVDTRLAALYGYRGATSERHTRVTLRGGQRGGVLTQGAVLATLATEQRESIIQRGMYVHRRLLCTEDLGRPPFDVIAAALGGTADFSERQLSDLRVEHEYCSGCHQHIDPPGRALHQFDGLGRLRAVDDVGEEVRSSGEIILDGARRSFGTAAQLGQLLARSEQVGRCVVDQLAHHALGREGDPALRGYLYRRFAAAGFDLVEVFRALATSPQFRLRADPGGPQ